MSARCIFKIWAAFIHLKACLTLALKLFQREILLYHDSQSLLIVKIQSVCRYCSKWTFCWKQRKYNPVHFGEIKGCCGDESQSGVHLELWGGGSTTEQIRTNSSNLVLHCKAALKVLPTINMLIKAGTLAFYKAWNLNLSFLKTHALQSSPALLRHCCPFTTALPCKENALCLKVTDGGPLLGLSSRGKCFPGMASVQTLSGRKRMSDVQVGDYVSFSKGPCQNNSNSHCQGANTWKGWKDHVLGW